MSISDTSAKKPGLFGKIGKWFREMRSELKKVVWPTFPQVLNNTGIVLTMIVLVGAIIAGFDFVWGKVVMWIISL